MLNNFETNIAQRIHEYEEPFQEMDWNAMETALDNQLASKKRRRGMIILGLTLLGFVMGLITWNTFRTEEKSVLAYAHSIRPQNSNISSSSMKNLSYSDKQVSQKGAVDQALQHDKEMDKSSSTTMEMIPIKQKMSPVKNTDNRVEVVSEHKAKTPDSKKARNTASARKTKSSHSELNKEALSKALILVGSKDNRQELIALETKKAMLELKQDSMNRIQEELKVVDLVAINKQNRRKVTLKPFASITAGVFADQMDSTFSIFPHIIGDVKMGLCFSNQKLFKLELSSGLGYRTNLLDLNFTRADYSIVDDTTTLVGIQHHYNSLYIPIEMKYYLPLKLKNWELFTAVGLNLNFIPNQHTDGKYNIVKYPMSNQGQPVMPSQQVVLENKNLADFTGSNSNTNLVSEMVVANRNKFYLSGYASFGALWKNRWMLEAVYLMESSIGSLGHKHNLGIRVGYKIKF